MAELNILYFCLMNFIKNNLANAFTLANLFSGCVGVIHLLNNDYKTAGFCLILSLVLDFFDGFVARALKSNSNLGVQLDSLADMVSFGFFPGVVLYKFLEVYGHTAFGIDFPFEIKYLGFFVTLFSCLRLAIFNLDEEQTYYFKGLNTPTNTVFLFGLYFLNQNQIASNTASFLELNNILNAEVLIVLTIICSWLLVSPIKMISMKFKSMKLEDNHPKLALLIGGIILLIALGVNAIPFLVIYYILISLVFQKQLK